MLVKPQEYLYISFEQLKTNLPDLSSDVMKKAPGIDPGNAHLNSEGGSISTADLHVLTG